MEQIQTTPSEEKVLMLLAYHYVLTANQISHLCGTGLRSAQKRIGSLYNRGLVNISPRNFGSAKGRPENVPMLNSRGFQYLKNIEKINIDISQQIIDKTKIEHEIQLNWFRVYLKYLQKNLSDLQTKFLSTYTLDLPLKNNGFPYISETYKSNNDEITFIPDGVFMIQSKKQNQSLLFFLEVDMSTEPLTSKDPGKESIEQKINNYQELFLNGNYKRYEEELESKFNGFRVLFLTNKKERSLAIIRLLENYSHDFFWTSDFDKMFNNGLGSKIWNRGGNKSELKSILGTTLAFNNPLPKLK